MKRYITGFITAVCITTSLFSQDKLITWEGTEYDGELISKSDHSVSFKAEGSLKPQRILVNGIQNLVLADGTIVIKNGEYFIGNSKKSFSKSNRNSKSNGNFTIIGGSLIGLAGVTLYMNNQRTLDENESLDEFLDSIKSYNDLAYISLFLGGVFIVIDNILTKRKDLTKQTL